MSTFKNYIKELEEAENKEEVFDDKVSYIDKSDLKKLKLNNPEFFYLKG